MFKIEKNVPIPTKGQNTSMANLVLETLNAMEIGDSFIVNKSEYAVFGGFKKFVSDKNKLFAAKRENEKSYRIFRLK